MPDDADQRWSEDPGWRLNWRLFLLAIPQLQMRYLRRAGGDALVMLRSLYLSFLTSLVLYGVVLAFILPFRGTDAARTWLIVIGVLAIFNALLVPRFERPLSCDSDVTLVEGYRTRFFLRIAFAESIALFGFVAAFTTNSSWVYFAAVFLSVPGFLRAAPTRAALNRDQDELTARGCGRSLVSAFRQRPAGN
jgi:F0F1-type ATP synthase membrane subunit c/vacuolar-type H+-ATPase subunit K